MSDKNEEIQIEHLKFRDACRIRPGMYIGGTENCDVLLREIIDNSVDEIHSSKSPCNEVRIDDTGSMYIIQDNGRGVPITPAMDDHTITMAVQSITESHAGSKFKKTEAAIGQNGIGSSAVFALSKEYNLILKLTENKLSNTTEEVKLLFKRSNLNINDAYLWYHGEEGYIKSTTVVNRDTINKYLGINIDTKSMTIVGFEPDLKIMLSRRAILPPTLKYVKYITKYNSKKDIKFYYNGKEYKEFFEPYKYNTSVKIISTKHEALNSSCDFLFSMEFMEEFGNTSDIGSVNGLIVNQGWHINYCRECFKRAFNAVFPDNYHGNEVKGIQFSTIALCAEPYFSSQTKERLTGIPGIDLSMANPLIKSIIKLIKDNRDAFELHRNKVLEYNASNKNISKLNFIKSKIAVLGKDGERRAAVMKPISLKDCSTKNRNEAELFICEGRSAAGSLMQARNAVTQAVIGLRGKPLNTTGLKVEDVIENPEIHDIVAAIATGVDDYFDLSKVMYGKIIIVADADPDGGNIASLLLGTFYGHMKYLINAGMVYICESPLFIQGDKYIYPTEVNKLDKNKPFSRIKGLGELNPSEMRKIACNKETRRLIRVTPEGMGEAIRLITTTAARRELLIDSGVLNVVDILTSKEVNGGK